MNTKVVYCSIAAAVLALSGVTARMAFAMQPPPEENAALNDLLRRVQSGATAPAPMSESIPAGDAYGPPVEPRPDGPSRSWYLYFPSAWWNPAIVGPPMRVYLDPPYGINDPFNRYPSGAWPRQTTPSPVYNQPLPPPAAAPRKPYSGPKVIEWNPATGQSDVVSPPRTGGTSSGAIRLPDPAPAPVPPPPTPGDVD